MDLEKLTPFRSCIISTVGFDEDCPSIEGTLFSIWAFEDKLGIFHAWTFTSSLVVPIICFDGALLGWMNAVVLTSFIGRAFSRFRFWASKSFLKFLWVLFSGWLISDDNSIPWLAIPPSTVFRFLLPLSFCVLLLHLLIYFWHNFDLNLEAIVEYFLRIYACVFSPLVFCICNKNVRNFAMKLVK